MAKSTKKTGLRAALASIPTRQEVVKIDELSEPVTVVAMDLADRIKLGEQYKGADGSTDDQARANAWSIAASIRDASGERIYNPDDAGDVDEVLHLAPHVKEALLGAVNRVNRFSTKAVEKAEKN